MDIVTDSTAINPTFYPEPLWGPDNPHPLSLGGTELLWPGKYDCYGNRYQPDLDSLSQTYIPQESHGNTPSANSNRLYHGDNLGVLASLNLEFHNRLQLIYIDPPFDVGCDFKLYVPLGEQKSDRTSRSQNGIELLAYRDRWGEGTYHYLHMMDQRLTLMRDLLCESGSIFVHVDWRVSGLIRLLLDEIFGKNNFVNEIIWCFSQGAKSKRMFGRKHNTIFWYAKTQNRYQFNPDAVRVAMKSGTTSFGGRLETDPDGRQYRLVYGSKNTQGKARYYKYYLDEGKVPEDYWTDINSLQSGSDERVHYATQKPEALLERILLATTQPGDWVADFFCGSGTTLAVAQKHDRHWLGCDEGDLAIHTCRKRLIKSPRAEKPARFSIWKSQALIFCEASLAWQVVYHSPHEVDILLNDFIPSQTTSQDSKAAKAPDVSGLDYLDYWAIQFNYTPDTPFLADWDSFRTRKLRNLKLQSDIKFSFSEPGEYTSCIQTVDVYGNSAFHLITLVIPAPGVPPEKP